MIYILGTHDRKDELQIKIFEFIRVIFRPYPKLCYKIILCDKHIIERKISRISDDDIVLWHPNVAYDNLSLVKKYQNSMVVLLSRTILIQKLSPRNPINENLAINNNFNLLYVDEVFSDVTNIEWKLAVQDDSFKVSHKTFIEIIQDEKHHKQTQNNIV
jgi:hypothetical protein